MRKRWKVGRTLFRTKVQEGVQYRLAALSGASISIFWGLIEIVVFTAFYTYGSGAAVAQSAMTLPQVISYVWIAQALVSLAPFSLDSEIRQKIINGDVALELCRPINVYDLWLFRHAGGRLSQLALRGTSVLLVGLVLPVSIGLQPPAGAAALGLTLLSLASAFVLCNAVGVLLCVLRLELAWGDGPIQMLMLVSQILSGTYLPLRLWPDALQPLVLALPFAGMVDTPARIYTGVLAPAAALGPIGLQIIWAAALIILGRVVLNRKLNKLVVQGG